MADRFDYVIVGAGTAGSTLAARLAERSGAEVCLLEAGPPDLEPVHPHSCWVHENADEPPGELAI
jgi:choline dehydrogenase-like flavoprotein